MLDNLDKLNNLLHTTSLQIGRWMSAWVGGQEVAGRATD